MIQSLLNKLWSQIKKIDPRQAWEVFCDYFFITMGLALYAFGYTLFLLPYKIVSGGVTGLSTIVYYVSGIHVSITYFIVNIALLALAFWALGWRFLIRTFYAIILLTLFLDCGQNLITNTDGSLIQILGPGQEFMGIVLGTTLAGFSLAIVFLHKGSTGGTDILAALVNKFGNFSIGQGIMMADLSIVCSTLFFPQFGIHIIDRLHIVVFGICVIFLETTILDWVMNQKRSSVQFMIFTEKYQEIANAVGTQLEHGVTILEGRGWYTGHRRHVLCILAKKNESVEIFRIIRNIDPKAFVSQSRVIGVYGEGFDTIRN